MSLTQQVTDLVTAAGRATVDDILLACGGLTRSQVRRGLRYAAESGHLEIVGIISVPLAKGATYLRIYAPPDAARSAGRHPRVSSVWELGSAA